ncbi:MAG: CCA tRNA nucleotidyltransferase [Hyphomicrobiaceae bacterium]
MTPSTTPDPRDPDGLPSIASADWLCRQETQALFAALCRDGFEARAVGGTVRNTLMGLPVADVDLATDAPPAEVTRLAEAAGFKVVPTGLEHGTLTVVVDRHPFEVTTLRHDVETFGRHARVAFTGDWEADARRRDFTMNALYATASGRVLDPIGGYGDLVQRRVRFIGDARARIREDYLRILRFFRFHATYGRGGLDEEGLAAALAEREGLVRLSAERVRAELVRILAASGAVPVVEAMAQTGFLTTTLAGVAHLAAFARMVGQDMAAGEPAEAMLRLATLAVRIPEDAERLTGRLRLANAEHEALMRLVAPRPKGTADMTDQAARALVYRLGPGATAALRYDRALAGEGDEAADRRWRELVALARDWQPPVLPVRGADLIALGLPPGPDLGRLLARLEEAFIAEDFVTRREDLLARATAWIAAAKD